jgi:hypothetical protein
MGIATVVTRDESVLQLFYNNNNNNLGFLFRNGATAGPDPKDSFEASGDGVIDGSIFNPSDMVGLHWNGVDWIFGITLPKKPKDGDYTTYSVSVVAPIYLPLVATEFGDKGLQNNRITAMTNGVGAWIYYLSNVGGNVRIKEWRFDTSTGNPLSSLTNVSLNSALASFYNTVTGRRHLIYQTADDYTLADSVPGGSIDPISPTSDAAKGTSLAATFNKGKGWLYYTDNAGHIHRINTGTEEGRWVGAEQLTDPPKASPKSQLSVVAANGINHLFYYQEGDKSPTHYRDFAPNAV